MKKKVLAWISLGVGAAIIWSVVFVHVLNSMAGIGVGMAGIGVGVCFGVPFAMIGTLLFKGREN